MSELCVVEIRKFSEIVEVVVVQVVFFLIEVEQQFLGVFLMNNEVYDYVLCVIQGKYFYDFVYCCIYEICVECIVKNVLVSLVMIKVYMENDVGLKELGGLVYLVCLVGVVILFYVVCDYVQMICEFVMCCELIQFGQDILLWVQMVIVSDSVEDQIKEVEQMFYKLGEQGVVECGF